MNLSNSRITTYFASGLLSLLVGALDYSTGSEIRVLPLYYLPLILAGWKLGKSGALLSGLFSTVIWLGVAIAEGAHYSSSYVLVINGVGDASGFLIVSFLAVKLRDVMERERAMGRTDPLTGLPNRRSFVDSSSVAIALCARHARPVSLGYLDLDNFKNVNDSYGHRRGDELLQHCARLMLECTRGTDLIARIGGDEFAFLLPETSAEAAAELAERMCAAIDSAVDFKSLGVTASIGVVSDRHGGLDINALLNKADGQMYAAKRNRKTPKNSGATPDVAKTARTSAARKDDGNNDSSNASGLR